MKSFNKLKDEIQSTIGCVRQTQIHKTKGGEKPPPKDLLFNF